MAGRSIFATLKIGASVASSVGSVFSALRGNLDGLSNRVAKIKRQRADLEAYGKSLARVTQLNAKLAAARTSGNTRAIDAATRALARENAALAALQARLSAAGVNTTRLAAEQDRLSRSLSGAESRLRRFTALSGAVNNLKGAFGGLMSTVKGYAGLMAGAGLGVAGAGYFFKTQFIDTAAAFEKYAIQLEAFGDNSEKALQWSTQFAALTPLNLDEVVKAFVKLRMQGLDPTDGTLQALTDGIFKVGGSFYDLEEVIIQLGQAWRKEKLTAEDVKPLINRGIPVYDMLAKSMGKTTKEIVQMQSEGKLGRKAISGMLYELGRWSKGTSQRMSKSWSGILGRMGDHWIQFTKKVMDSGPFVELKSQLEQTLQQFQKWEKDGTLKRWAEDTGKALVSFIREVKECAVATWKTVSAIKEAVGGWKNFGLIIGAIALIPLIASVAQLTVAMWGLAAASWSALGPWGLLAVAVIAGVAALIIWRKEIRAWIDEHASWIKYLLGPGAYAILYWDELKETWEGLKIIANDVFNTIEQTVGRVIDGITNKIVSLIQTVTNLITALKSISNVTIGGSKVGDIGGALLDTNPITGPLRMARRGAEALMSPSSMPIARGAANAAANAINNVFHINVNAPGADGNGIADKLRSNLKNKPLGDSTGVSSLPQ